MIVYHQRFANILHNSVIIQSLLIWATSLIVGGYPAAVLLALSCLSIILMWILALGFSVLIAFILPLVLSSPVPYVANPWLVVGLFAAPALLGALTGQHLGYLFLQTYLPNVHSKRKLLSPAIQADLIKLEAERWLYKAGSVQWLILLVIGNYYKIGSSYLALVWLVPPAFACKFTYITILTSSSLIYGMHIWHVGLILLVVFASNWIGMLDYLDGLLEATLSPARLPKPLKLATLLMGLAVPILISAGIFIQLAGTVIGTMVRFDRYSLWHSC